MDESSLNSNGVGVDFAISSKTPTILNNTSKISEKMKDTLRHKRFQLVVNPKCNAERRETISVVILYPAECVESVVQFFGPYLNDLYAVVEKAPWLTKKVVISMVSSSSETYPSLKSHIFTATREVYIFKLDGWLNHCQQSVHEFKWSHVQINHIGWNGNFPNMDLVSASEKLVAHYNVVDKLGQSRSRFSPKRDDKLFDDHVHNVKQFVNSFSNLIGGPNGMHSEYLFNNIDSLSFTLQFTEPNTTKLPKSMHNLEDLGNLMLQVLQQSCKLEGKFSFLFHISVVTIFKRNCTIHYFSIFGLVENSSW